MRIAVILNRHGGTLRGLDIDAFSEQALRVLAEAGHTASILAVEGDDLVATLDQAASDTQLDAVIAGGGDGTISAAAERLMNTGKALGVLPAGTMNLFARSLGIPLDLNQAVTALAAGRLRKVDMASANDVPFVHQLSIGLHPKLIRLRERRSFNSRLGKMLASVRAAFDAVTRPPRLRLQLSIDGAERTLATSNLGITNNLFGEGHLPYADAPDGGVLGVYVTQARRRRDILRFLLNVAIGRWRANQQVEIMTAHEVVVRLARRHSRFGCSIDGELCDLATETVVRIHPGSLTVLVPPDA